VSAFLEGVRTRASALSRRIVFPESADPRTRDAIAFLEAKRIVEPIVVDPERDARRHDVAATLLQLRERKGMTPAEAERLARTPLYFADWLVRMGHADGCVAGAVHTTAEVLRAAFWLVGPAAGVRTVSSAFYMVVGPFRDGMAAEVLTFTDCAVIPAPGVTELADIAIAAADDRRRIVGDTPILAFLSYSTYGSADGESVTLVRNAVAEVRRRRADLAVDGELQGDAALIPAVAARKAGSSPVAGRANILVYPSLDAGNIAYKLVERLAGATAVGPIVQGLRRPCSDLSRGATTDDIINVAAITALQAGDSPTQPSTAEESTS
jgi:phosphate acetyltransferase